MTTDLNNNGVSNTTITNNGATLDASGKLGKCYAFTGNHYLSFPTTLSADTKEFSISFWVNIAQFIDNFACIFSTRTATGGKGVAIWITGSYIRFDDGTTNTWNYTFSFNTWTHICVTWSITTKAIYVNGVLLGSHTSTGSLSNLHATTKIGSDTKSSTYYLEGRMNDFRLYDHALSTREIEILSRGLALHYPMSLPMPNLAKGSNTADISTNVFIFSEATGGSTRTIEYDDGIPCAKITRNSTAHSSWSYLHYDNWDRVTIKPSTTYTLSFDVIGSGSGSIGFTGFLNGNGTNSINASVEEIQNTFNADRWSHLVFRTTTIDDFTGKGTGQTIYMTCSYLKNTDVWIMMKNMKLEEGSRDTPWIPHTSDAGYSTMGFNDNIEYDVSGYNYHGEKLGTITYDSDSPRYSSCTVFNGVDSAINCGDEYHVQGAQNMTISLWAYLPDWAVETTQPFVSCQESGGFIISRINGTSIRGRFDRYTASDLSTRGYAQSDYACELTGWHMITATYDTSAIKLYLDGVHVKTSSSTTYGVHFTDNVNTYIGAEATTKKRCIAPFINGKVSDVRIYYTTLTAIQVAELYNTAASITDSGTLMGYEFVEQ